MYIKIATNIWQTGEHNKKKKQRVRMWNTQWFWAWNLNVINIPISVGSFVAKSRTKT